MKMKMFEGKCWEAIKAFNEWVRGKALTKDVIIHTHVQFSDGCALLHDYMKIIVIHPEDPFWDATCDTTEPEPIRQEFVDARLER